jgi:hypothetical protein
MKKGSETWLTIGLITIVTLLTYGVLIPQLGFYRDDWYLFSTAQSHGSAGIVALFQIDRPLVGYLYALGYKLLGLSPLAWQGVTLLFRLAGNLAIFWLLRLLWPDRKMETLAVTLLFSVYPGFTVQPNAGVYITDLLASACALVSIALTIKALHYSTGTPPAKRGLYVLLSVVAGLLALFYLGIFESAIGLEAARFALIGYVIWRRDQAGLRSTVLRTIMADLFYLLLGISFLVWRLFFFQSTRRATNLGVLLGKYGALPVHSVLSVTVETLKDIIETTVFAWVVPFYQFVATSNYRDLIIALFIAVAVVVCIYMVFRTIGPKPGLHEAASPSDPSIHLVWLGLFIVVFALLPIDAAGRNVLFSDQWDRYTIYASMGVAMVIAGFIFHFFKGPTRSGFLFVLIGMSVVVHYFSAASYRDFWSAQRDLWQQMIWRAPSLRPGTMLFASPSFAGYEEGYEIYGPANMVYYPGQGVQLGGDVLNSDTAANLQLQKNREHYDRNVLVPDNYRNALIAIYPGSQSCLHILDGRKVELPGLIDNSLVADIASYSRIDQIDPSAAPVSLPSFLSGEHPREWCFYYQKMDLARQQGNWQEVTRLADEAQKKGLTPEDPSEWMPALEAYITLGRVQDARHAASIIRASDKARSFLCLQLQRGSAYPTPYNYDQVNQLLCQAN